MLPRKKNTIGPGGASTQMAASSTATTRPLMRPERYKPITTGDLSDMERDMLMGGVGAPNTNPQYQDQIANLWNVSGRPGIFAEDDKSLRASYLANTNTMNIKRGSEDDFIAESAHALQNKLGTLKNRSAIPTFLRDAFPRVDSATYNTPGHFEYEAHGTIEPKLVKFANDGLISDTQRGLELLPYAKRQSVNLRLGPKMKR